MSIYQPYTYLIGWSNHNKWYYGVRYAAKCNPSDLWTRYFTSSKEVKKFRQINGEPDIIQIRKIFSEAKKAKHWEDKVLRRLKVHLDDSWLNIRKDTFSGIVMTEEMKDKIGKRAIGNTRTRGYTNEFRKQKGMKIISGKKRGSKEKYSTKIKKSETRKGKTTVRDKNGNCFLAECNDTRFKTGEIVSVMVGVRLGHKHSKETVNRLSEIAKKRPTWYCGSCDTLIKGKMNWSRHLYSKKHQSSASREK
jgi:hypothetical protein